MDNNPTYFALLKACSQPGCPICRMTQQAVERYLDHLFYENVNDSSVRAHLRGSLGFCREHSELLLETGLGDALGMSIIYHDVFGTVLKRLRRQNPPPSDGSIFARLLGRVPNELAYILEKIKQAVSSHESCLACQQRESTAHIVFMVLIENFFDKEMHSAFTKSDGLCFPHLRQICKLIQDGAVLAELLKIEINKIEELHLELNEFIRKSDYRFMKEELGKEGNAWRRAALFAAGGWIDSQSGSLEDDDNSRANLI